METDTSAAGVILENPPMAIPKLEPRTTVDQYLARERTAAERSIYLDGEIFAMAGESPVHGDISANLLGTMVPQLKGTPCRARTKDTKVRSGLAPMTGHGAKGLFSYPDIVVIFGEPEYHDAHKDVVLNPKAIIEVLSPATEAFDRGEKFTRLQLCNPTLIDYILVSQDRPQIEHYHRQPDGEWTYRLQIGLESSVTIASIGCTLKFVDVYDRVVFPEGE